MSMTEAELSAKFNSFFSQYFYVTPEVWDDSGKFRIDYILRDRKSLAVFGIECKTPGNKRGENVGNIVLQAMRYSMCKWNGVRVPIFIVPEISHNIFTTFDTRDFETKVIQGRKYYREKHELFCSHHTFNGFLGSMNVGEVRREGGTNYCFSHSNFPVYRTYGGLHDKHYQYILKKINSFEDRSGLCLCRDAKDTPYDYFSSSDTYPESIA